MADSEVLQRVLLALSQAKRTRNEAGITVQMLAGVRDTLQGNSPQGEANDGKQDTQGRT